MLAIECDLYVRKQLNLTSRQQRGIKSDEKLINISKNHRIICSAALLERHGGSSGRPEAARGLKSRFVTGFRSPVGPHFDDAGSLEGGQKAFGRGLRCALLEKSIFEGCI